MSHRASTHPLDTDLLDFAEGLLDPAARELIEAHLNGCLLCRIKRQRLTGAPPIDFADVRELTVPGFGKIEVEEASGIDARPGELWLTASDEATMVLVRSVRNNESGLVVVPVTLDVEVGDSGTLILDQPESPLGVPLVIYERLLVSLPSTALSGRVVPVRTAIDLLALGDGDTGVSRGSALEGPADPRLEIRQYLSDRLVALDPYQSEEDFGDEPSVGPDARLAALRDELTFRRGSGCEVEDLASLPLLAVTPDGWAGIARIKDFTVRVLVIDTPAGLNDAADFLSAQVLLTRLDGSALAVCTALTDTADLYDAPTLFGAFELPAGRRAAAPLISGLSLPDTVAKFLEQKRVMLSAIGPSEHRAAPIDVQQVLADEVAGAVAATVKRATRLGPDKKQGYSELAGLSESLVEVLRAAFEANFDPHCVSELAEDDDA